jgi:hypothetical protein
MLSDKDEFHDPWIEMRMRSRGHMVVAHFSSGRWEFVSNFLKNTAFRIDRDLEAMGLLPKESLKL